MGKIEEMESRIGQLEEMMDATIVLLNKLIDDFYEPGYVKKLDRMAERYLKEEMGYEQESET